MYYKLSVLNITKITFLIKFRYFRNSTNNSTPPIRSDLFRGHGWNTRLISRKRLETNYFANAIGRDLFRESIWKGLILKPIFERFIWAHLNN